MKTFLFKAALFFLPFLAIIPIELSVRNNTYKLKAEYVKTFKDSIEILILGSSQTNKGLNPEDLDFIVAPLANDGSTLNLDYLLFERYFDQLPNLKFVMFELSYHALEDSKPNDWNKNHLFYNYYKINNYGKEPPLSEKFLVTSNPKLYLMRYFTPVSKLEDSKFNDVGFILNSTSRFHKYDYDSVRISESSQQEYMEGRHQKIDLENFKNNVNLMDNAIEKCLNQGVKVILLSPPKHYLYNQNMREEKLERRDKFFDKYKNRNGVYIWNYERLYENRTEWFLNEDHLNPEGAKIFASDLNKRLKEAFKDSVQFPSN